MGAATATDTCTGDADIITGGPGAAATTSIATTDRPSLDSRSPFHCPGERELQRQERVAPRGAAGSAIRELQDLRFSRRSAEAHLHRDPDQVRMILGAELLLEQRGGIGHRLVGNLQRIGDFDDLVAAAQ